MEEIRIWRTNMEYKNEHNKKGAVDDQIVIFIG